MVLLGNSWCRSTNGCQWYPPMRVPQPYPKKDCKMRPFVFLKRSEDWVGIVLALAGSALLFFFIYISELIWAYMWFYLNMILIIWFLHGLLFDSGATFLYDSYVTFYVNKPCIILMNFLCNVLVTYSYCICGFIYC